MTDWSALIERAKQPAPRRRAGRPPLPREHGSQRGYDQHRTRHERPCPACCDGHTRHNNPRPT